MADPVRAADLSLSDGDLVRLAARFGVGELKLIGGFENLLFRSADPSGRIVRMTHTSRRSVDLVSAELAFMRHLADRGVPVVAPCASIDGELAEPFTLDDGSATVVCCMSEAPGEIKHPHLWSDADLVAMGELLGGAHVAAASFEPAGPERPVWTDPIFDPGVSLLGDAEFTEAWKAVTVEAARHPAGGTGLLIHGDAHPWNLHVDGTGRLTLFDFDDCAYGTAVHDIAITLFYWLLVGWDDDRAATRRFFEHVLEGYRRHTALDDGWEVGVDLFLKVREADIFLLLSIHDDADTTERRWMEGRRHRVLDRVPLLDVPLADVLG